MCVDSEHAQRENLSLSLVVDTVFDCRHCYQFHLLDIHLPGAEHSTQLSRKDAQCTCKY
jgi:hypothetical protein